MSLGALVVDIAHSAIRKLRNRPKAVARRKARAEKKRGERPADEAAGEFFSDDKETTVNMNLLIALAGSLIRHALPWATALLAGAGIQVSDGSSPWFTIGLAVGVYGVMQGVSFYRQWQKNRATPPANG